MSRVLFALVSVFALGLVSSAFATGSSTYISQTGTGEIATIDQTASTGEAMVGTVTNAFLQQNGGGNGGNKVRITQGGSGNSVEGLATGVPSGTRAFRDIR
jgi:hypothetical protein